MAKTTTTEEPMVDPFAKPTTTTTTQGPELPEDPGDIGAGSILYPLDPHDSTPISSWGDYNSKMLQSSNIRNVSINKCSHEESMENYYAANVMASQSTPATGQPSQGNTIKKEKAPIPPSPPPPVFFDTTFGTNGFNATSLSGNDRYNGVALQSNGKIVGAGRSGSKGVSDAFSLNVGRYNSNGSLDNTFGVNGFASVMYGSNNGIAGVAIQSDGKIVISGAVAEAPGNPGTHTLVGRFNPNGSLDTTFGTNGFAVFAAIGFNMSFAMCVAIQSDGKILVGGLANVNIWGFGLIRYNPDGSLDLTFNTTGYNTTTPGSGGNIISLVVQSDGKILAGCTANSGFALVRYNSNGTFDTTFNTTGYNLTTPGTNDSINSIALQPDGKIVAGGSVTTDKSRFAVARYNSDGSLDTTFGTNGFNISTPGTGDTINAVIVRPDGKIVAGGVATVGGNAIFTLACYNSDGSLNTSFCNKGFCLDTPVGLFDFIHALALQSDGKIVAGGECSFSGSGDNTSCVVARYNAGGVASPMTMEAMSEEVIPTSEEMTTMSEDDTTTTEKPKATKSSVTTTTTTHRPTTTTTTHRPTTTTTTHRPTTTTTTHRPTTTTTTTHRPTTTTTHRPTTTTTTTTHKPTTTTTTTTHKPTTTAVHSPKNTTTTTTTKAPTKGSSSHHH